MTAQEFVEKLKSFKPDSEKSSDWGARKDMADRWSEYILLKKSKDSKFVVEELNNRLNISINIERFDIYATSDWLFDDTFEEDGFYPFGFYVQDYLFIKLKTGRVEARDLTLTKFYDVAKDEQSFLEAFLLFAKHYAYHLEHLVPNSDMPFSIPIEQRRDLLNDVLKLVGGKKYRLFWAQVFQAWSDEELKEMEE